MPRAKRERPANLPPAPTALISPRDGSDAKNGVEGEHLLSPDAPSVPTVSSAATDGHRAVSATPPNNWLHLNGDFYVEVGTRLRGGAVGTVYVITVHKLGHPERAEKRVMKIVPNSNKRAIERERKHFSREVAHPNVLKYLYVGKALGHQRETAVQLHMPLMNYGALSTVLLCCGAGKEDETTTSPKGGPLSCIERLRLLINVGYQLVTGIHYFHHFFQGMHRDIKPDNILLNSEGRVKVCDFDTCIDDGKSGRTWCGTPIYIAPEVATNAMAGESYAPKCDEWMIGITLKEVFTGWHGPNLRDLLLQDESERYHFTFEEVKRVVDECRVKLETKIREWSARGEGEFEDKVQTGKITYYTELLEAALSAEDFLRSALKPDPTERMDTGQMLSHPLFHSVVKRGAKIMEKETLKALADSLRNVGVKIHIPGGGDGNPTAEEQIQSWAALKKDPSLLKPSSSPYRIESFADVNKLLSDLLFHQQSSCHADLKEWLKVRAPDLSLL